MRVWKIGHTWPQDLDTSGIWCMGGQRYGTRLRSRNAASGRMGWDPGRSHTRLGSPLARHCRPAVAWLPLWQAQVVRKGCPLKYACYSVTLPKILYLFLEFKQTARSYTSLCKASAPINAREVKAIRKAADSHAVLSSISKMFASCFSTDSFVGMHTHLVKLLHLT